MNNTKTNLLKSALLIALFCGISSFSSAQKTAFEMSDQMIRGINLGNTFDAKGFEGNWAPAATEKDFDAFKEAGFTCVRIPITWHSGLSETDSTLRLAEEKPYKVEESFFTRVDEVIKWSLDRGFVTIINIHHDDYAKDSATFDQSKERFYALWKQMSKHYKDYPENLLFEMINEPHHSTDGVEDGLTQTQLNELNKETLAIIRKHNPTRIAIYTGKGWSSLWDLKATPNPAPDDKYLMATYHSYSPWPFAGDGNGSWGTDEDKASQINEFETLKEYSKKYNVPVLIGEYGAQHQCGYNDRMLHYACYVENIVKYNVATTTWDDGGYLFKVYDRKTGVWDDAKDIIVNYGPTSPNQIKLTIVDGNFVTVEWKNRAQNISKTSIEYREGRIGQFKEVASVETETKYIEENVKKNQTDYYYRVVNHFEDGSILMSYPQKVYIP